MVKRAMNPRARKGRASSQQDRPADAVLNKKLLKAPRKKTDKAPKNKPPANMATSFWNIVPRLNFKNCPGEMHEEALAADAAVEDSTDDDDADDTESEAFAPSGRTIEGIRHQTGLLSAKDTERLSTDGPSPSQLFRESGYDSSRELRELSSQASDNDDDGYAAVDDISLSEPSVESLEEDLIKKSMENEWPEHVTDNDFLAHNLPPLFELNDRSNRWSSEDALNTGMASVPTLLIQRRVRFADVLDVPNTMIGDNDSGNADHLGNNGLYQSDDNRYRRFESLPSAQAAIQTPEESPVQSSFGSDERDGDLSGYETDEGETTDDEVRPPLTVNRPQALLHSSSSVPKQASSAPIPASVYGKRGPKKGSFIRNRSKPVVIVGRTGRLISYPPLRPSKTRMLLTNASTGSSAPSSPFASFVKELDEADKEREKAAELEARSATGSAMIGTGTNLMLPGLIHTAPGVDHGNKGNVSGPPEAFFSLERRPAGSVVTDEDFDMSVDGDGDSLFPFEDFIDFGDSSSDNGEIDPVGKPLSPSSTEHPGHTLLDHFSRGDVVTAFRQNQSRYTAAQRNTDIHPAPHALKGPRFGEFSISPGSPIKRIH